MSGDDVFEFDPVPVPPGGPDDEFVERLITSALGLLPLLRDEPGEADFKITIVRAQDPPG